MLYVNVEDRIITNYSEESRSIVSLIKSDGLHSAVSTVLFCIA